MSFAHSTRARVNRKARSGMVAGTGCGAVEGGLSECVGRCEGKQESLPRDDDAACDGHGR